MKKYFFIKIPKSIRILLFSFLLIAVFAPQIANDKPLYISFGGKFFFPAFSSDPYIEILQSNGTFEKKLMASIDWKNLNADKIIFPLVCWSPAHSDLQNIYVSPFGKQFMMNDGITKELPFRFRHFLGTGKTGDDVLSGLIHGLKTSLSIGIFSMIIAIFLGIVAGGIAGYFGDSRFKIKRGQLFLSVLLIIPAWFYAFVLSGDLIKSSESFQILFLFLNLLIRIVIFFAILFSPMLINFSRFSYFNRAVFIPVDSIISRCIELFLSLPRLILILVIASIVHPSLASVILIIGITSWTEIARVVRARILQLREMNYISAVKSTGATSMRILLKHIFPNTISQIAVIGIFGVASAVLVETGLSFLGIGIPAGTASWGSLMFEAKENYRAWWLVIFSGAAIFLFLSVLYKAGNLISPVKKEIP